MRQLCQKMARKSSATCIGLPFLWRCCAPALISFTLLRSKRIERRVVDGDRRARHLFLTAEGKSVYSEIVPLALDYERRLAASLGAAERAQLEKLLAKLTTAAGTL